MTENHTYKLAIMVQVASKMVCVLVKHHIRLYFGKRQATKDKQKENMQSLKFPRPYAKLEHEGVNIEL